MTMDTFVTNFVDAMDLDTVIVWADILNVPHNESQWIDDDFPDKSDELRVAVVEAMLNVGELKKAFDGLQTNPMPIKSKEKKNHE